MGTMVNTGKELVRICPSNVEKVEYSTNGGANWTLRCAGGYGRFSDLTENGNEILGTTDKGLYYSTNGGANWTRRN